MDNTRLAQEEDLGRVKIKLATVIDQGADGQQRTIGVAFDGTQLHTLRRIVLSLLSLRLSTVIIIVGRH